ncbi:LytTR family DNA-binding domain-containing protein [Streptococcus zalophi]|uniref:LytTR family transcriptional regulator DNA-binding domain-containing protein n=1 Tax=Streptococcus zalophi TaxID=640031 RepID=A0A934PA97_9STRE|nr:LytTR family DNA-binding domain-containing protein [Streptococcus zalophi]MBJ8349959.1 LytTR family transcriptional regulator DNA-binding domain-containing protein [Streptococcus zalophi]MCR8966954.1 LytTR family transcriptional regulator DNA-binding domain-containing protein [Streptococcus zalophi]
MDCRFEEDRSKKQLEIIIKKASYDKEVADLFHYLELFSDITPNVIPVKTEDRIVLLKVEDLILVDVDATHLILETMTGTLRTNDRLYKFKDRLKNPDFVQVSKQSLININHLNYLEASFSGNMTARLDRNIRTIVSRRYLKDLEARLGL